MTALSASLYAADPFRLAEMVEAVSPHVESFHLDIMDGDFAPDFGLNARLIGDLAARTQVPLDAHLMVRDPRRIAARYAGLGLRSVAVHLEGDHDFAEIAAILRNNGTKAFAAIRHSTGIEHLHRVADVADGFLLLTAPAGGGDFQPDAFARLAARPSGLPVIVDGRIAPAHFDRLRGTGVDLAVIGAALFAGGDPGRRARELAAQLAGTMPASVAG